MEGIGHVDHASLYDVPPQQIDALVHHQTRFRSKPCALGPNHILRAPITTDVLAMLPATFCIFVFTHACDDKI